MGSRNEFDQVLVHWLSRRTELAGVVWTSSTAWAHSWEGRLGFARTRLRRRGPLKTADEAAFWFLYHRVLRERERDTEELRSRVILPYVREHGEVEWRG